MKPIWDSISALLSRPERGEAVIKFVRVVRPGNKIGVCPDGAKPAADLDAISLVPVLQGGTITAPRDLYFVRREGGAADGGKSYEAIIRGDWKLMQNDPSVRWKRGGATPWQKPHLIQSP